MDANYFQTLAAEPQQSAPIDAPKPPTVATVSAQGVTNGQGEMVTKDALIKLVECLQALDSRMDKLESMVTQQPSPAPIVARTSAAIAPLDDYETPVPTIQQRRTVESKQDAIAWICMGGIVAVLAGTIAYVATMNPSAQAETTNQALSTQIEAKDRVIESLADKASKSQCKALCF